MTKIDPIIAVKDVEASSKWYQQVFGFKIAQDVRDNIFKVEGINDVKVNVSNHFMAEAINKQVNESKKPSEKPDEKKE